MDRSPSRIPASATAARTGRSRQVADQDREELTRLRVELQELLDRQAIADCVYRYARGLDRHDEEIYASAYHDDAIDHHGDFLGRRDKFVPWGLALLASDWDS